MPPHCGAAYGGKQAEPTMDQPSEQDWQYDAKLTNGRVKKNASE